MLLKSTSRLETVTWSSVYVRLVRHYGYLYVAVVLGWIFKVLIALPHDASLALLIILVLLACVLVAGVVYWYRPADSGLSFPPQLRKVEADRQRLRSAQPAAAGAGASTRKGHAVVV
jgi:hypothetical protein